jgi:hypothetical protein
LSSRKSSNPLVKHEYSEFFNSDVIPVTAAARDPMRPTGVGLDRTTARGTGRFHLPNKA